MCEIETKVCKSCGEEFPLSNFYFRKESNKYRDACKKCKRVTTKEEIIKRANADTKICKHCGIEKPQSEYQKAGGGRWTQPYCKPCDKIRKQKHRDNNIDSIKKREHEKYIKTRKLLPTEIRLKNKESAIKKLVEFNKVRFSNMPKLTNQEWKKRKSEYGKKYREKNKESLQQRKKSYTRTEKGKLKAREWQKSQMSDKKFVIKKRLMGRVYCALKRGVKSASTIELLGCSIDFFKSYIEGMFHDGINWDNMGEWHIDHIKPCKLFDLSKEEEQRKCFHYTNLQPLLAIDNLKKGAKYYG